jgi:toxin ParE1/3/4
MPADVIWSRQARADLLDIYVLIGLERQAAAERYFDRIEAKAALLARNRGSAYVDATFAR